MSLLTRQPRFLIGAEALVHCPADRGAEVALAGRSNVGKSSALNALAGRRQLARISRTPGRTRQINFFALDEQGDRRLVDLPGYGYARVSRALRARWDRLLEDYLRRRRSLRGLALLVDARHGLKEFDRQMLAWCRSARMPVVVVLTKADKLGRARAARALQETGRRVREVCPGAEVLLFSATARQGLDALRQRLEAWLQGTGDVPGTKKAPDQGMGIRGET